MSRIRALFGFECGVSIMVITIVILMQFGAVTPLRADYGLFQTDNMFAYVINGSANFTANIFDSVRNFLYTVSGGKIGGTAQALDGKAIRAKNHGTPISVFEATTTEPSVNINAPAGFKNDVQFGNGFTSDIGVTINGIIKGQGIDVAAGAIIASTATFGTVTASNILYGITAGEGIDISGDLQRPTLSSSNFFKKEGTTIMTRDPSLSLAIGGSLTVGSPAGSLLHLLGKSTIAFDSYALTTIAPNLFNAWSIATSPTTTPIISIDSRNEGSVAIGTASSSAKLSVKNSQLGSVAFQITAANNQQANLFEIRDASEKSIFAIDPSGHIGIGTTSSKDIALAVNGTSTFSGGSTFSGVANFKSDVHFGSAKIGIGTDNPTNTLSINGTFNVTKDATFANAPILSSVISCAGGSVLETDGDGRITCGQDDVGSSAPTPKDKGEVKDGASGSLAYYTGGNVVSGAANLFYDPITATLGIGTTTPFAPLSLSTSTKPQLLLTDSSAAANTRNWYASSTQGSLTFGTMTDTLVNSTSADISEKIRITNAGLFGIGTTSPGSMLSIQAGNLQVTGTTTAHALVATSTLFVGAQGQLFNVMQSGFVGVGTTSPVQLLSVAGHCVTGDTRLRRRRKRKNSPSTSSGTNDDEYDYDEVKIKDIQQGDEIASLNEKTGRIVWSKVNALMDMGVKTTYRLRTEDGREIRTTANHPYLTRYGWTKVAFLRKGMTIAVPRLLMPAALGDDRRKRHQNNGKSNNRKEEINNEYVHINVYSFIFKIQRLINHRTMVATSPTIARTESILSRTAGNTTEAREISAISEAISDNLFSWASVNFGNIYRYVTSLQSDVKWVY